MRRKSKRETRREIERRLEVLEDRGLPTSTAVAKDVPDEMVSAIESASKHRLRNPEQSLPEDIAEQLSPRILAEFQGDG